MPAAALRSLDEQRSFASAPHVDGAWDRGGDGGVAALGGTAQGEAYGEAEGRAGHAAVERLHAAVLLALAAHHRAAGHAARHHADEPGDDLERRTAEPRTVARA